MVIHRGRWIVTLVSFFVVMCSWSGVALAQTTSQKSPDMLAIQGRWVRTDAPYVIVLRHVESDSLQATYFNPRPIHVAKTETAEQDGLFQVLIELQDVNYPGSTYVLAYDRGQDVLQGTYFHPASRQSYKVEFVRQNTL